MVEPHSSNSRVITTNFLGVRIFRKFTVFYQKLLKSLSSVMIILLEVKTSESSQQYCQNTKFNNMDYLSCQCNCFLSKTFLCIIFYQISEFSATHVSTV